MMRGNKVGIEGIEEMLKDLLGETLGKLKGESGKCECLTCKCMDAIEAVIEKEFQSKGKEYQQGVNAMDLFIRTSGSTLEQTGIAAGNSANTLQNVLESIVKNYVMTKMSFKVIESRGYKGI